MPNIRRHTKAKSPLPSNSWPVSNFDLIDGTGTVSFTAILPANAGDYIGFLVTPANFNASFPPDSFRISGANRYNLQLPRKPLDGLFLYEEWQTDDEMASHIFTLETLPIDGAPVQTMEELGSWKPEPAEAPANPISNNVPQNTTPPAAANLTQPTYDGAVTHSSWLLFWLWLIGGLIVLTIGTLAWLALKKRISQGK